MGVGTNVRCPHCNRYWLFVFTDEADIRRKCERCKGRWHIEIRGGIVSKIVMLVVPKDGDHTQEVPCIVAIASQ